MKASERGVPVREGRRHEQGPETPSVSRPLHLLSGGAFEDALDDGRLRDPVAEGSRGRAGFARIFTLEVELESLSLLRLFFRLLLPLQGEAGLWFRRRCRSGF